MNLNEYRVCPRCDNEWHLTSNIAYQCKCSLHLHIASNQISTFINDENDKRKYFIAWNLNEGSCLFQVFINYSWSIAVDVPYLDYKISIDKLEKILVFL